MLILAELGFFLLLNESSYDFFEIQDSCSPFSSLVAVAEDKAANIKRNPTCHNSHPLICLCGLILTLGGLRVVEDSVS